MKHVITCSNVRCRYNDGYTHCECKTIGMTIDGRCATFVPIRVKEHKKIDISTIEDTCSCKEG